MLTDLAQAPVGVSLCINRIPDEAFASRMERLGLREGTQLMRLSEMVSVSPVKVRGAKGDAVISAWLAGQVVIHLDDGRRIPLPECPPRASGHVEGVTGHDAVESSLYELGIAENDRITVIRRVPPMKYHCTVDGQHGAWMHEGLAAHLIGDTAEGPAQFSSVGVGEEFVVRRILPGDDAVPALASMKVAPGATLVLTSVSVSPDVRFSAVNPVACVTRDGLRLYFREQDAAGILVVVVEDES